MKAGWALSGTAAVALLVYLLAMQGDDETSRPRPEEPREKPSDASRPRNGPAETPRETVRDRKAQPITGLRLRGSVLDGPRPAPGATVTLRLAGRPVQTTRATADGSFTFPLGKPPSRYGVAGSLVARLGNRVASRSWYFEQHGPEERAVEPLVLKSAQGLRVRVVAGGRGVAQARVTVMQLPPKPDTPQVRFEIAGGTADTTGVVSFPHLPPGRLLLLAGAVGHGPGNAIVTLKDTEAGQAEVVLGPERVLEVEVVDKERGHGIPGARIRVHLEPERGALEPQRPRLPVPPTDRDGRTTVRGLPAGPSPFPVLAVEAEGYTPLIPDWMNRGGVSVRDPKQTKVRVELIPVRILRWRVVPGESVVPPDKAPIRLRTLVGSGVDQVHGTARMEGTDLVVEGAHSGWFSAVAIAPDGSLARLWAGKDGSTKPVSFRAPRSITIRAKTPEGDPVPGIYFAARNQGNNPFGPPVRTDDEGVAAIRNLYGQRADVYQVPNPKMPYSGHRVGTLDLEKGSGTVEVVIHPEIEVAVTVRPLLPPKTQLFLAGRPVRAERDETNRRLVCRFAPASNQRKLFYRLTAPGYLPAYGPKKMPPPGSPLAWTVDLKPAARLVVHVTLPPDKRYTPQLQIWNTEDRRWTPAFAGGSGSALPGNKGYRYDGLAPGRYRMIDARSSTASEAADIAPGHEARVVLDLSRVATVRGRVEAPAGTNLTWVRVMIAGDAGPSHPFQLAGKGVRKDGSFELRVPGTRAVTLRAVHAVLSMDPKAPPVRVREARGDVVLKLVRTTSTRFRPGSEKVPTTRGFQRLRVLLYAGTPRGRPLRRFIPLMQEDHYRFGGYTPGTYTLWIDRPGFAPTILRKVKLGDAETDLGEVAFDRGSTIRCKILVKKGTAPPRIGLFAHRLDAPSYNRGMNSNGEATAVLRGLGPGRFKVSASPIMGMYMSERIDQEVELDGRNEVVLELDLR